MRKALYLTFVALWTLCLLFVSQPVSSYSAGSQSLYQKVDISNPITLESSMLYTGGPLNSGEDLWFSFIPKQTGSYEISVRGEGGLSGTLFDAHSSKIIMQNETVEGSDILKLANTCLAEKNYFIKVSSIHPGAFINQLEIAIEELPAPNDEFFNEQWSLFNPLNGIDINIIPVWKNYKGSNITIGVADTGVDYQHPDLINRLDMSLAYNFTHDMKDVFPENEKSSASSARAGHGTHVSGIISAQSNNNQGIAGITSQGSVVPLKVLGSRLTDTSVYNGSIAAFVKAVEYAKANDIRIINCSFGGANPAVTEQEAMYQANDILFVIAAGNSGSNLADYPEYPASYYHDNSLVVAAQNMEGNLAAFSNYGGPTDIAAPGESIISTFPNSLYLYNSGTSMAAPVVSAVSGLVWGNAPYLTALEVKEIVTDVNNVTLVDSLSNKVHSGGMVNAFKAMMSAEPRTESRRFENKKRDIFGENLKSSIDSYLQKADEALKTNQIIVKFAAGVNAEEYINTLEKEELLTGVHFIDYLSSVDAYVLQLSNMEEADKAITALNNSNNILYAEPNYLRESN
ncbi:S8 family serine peptidase [Paenibacillus sp. FSL R7-0297]|uniref:S8 family serine peptidase n=1 Tax=unclassified Paenibacillus TaxID=185978 RepID=UPI0009E01A7B|nr:S8 family serine peptidase [Paenibacillus sp. FSL R5-0912]